MVPDAPLEPPCPWTRRIPELLIPALILCWRVAAVAPLRLATDIVAVLSFWWVYTVFAEKTRGWRIVTGSLVFYLLALYCSRQLPAVLTRFAGDLP
jgi:hypothetical protein